VAAVMHDAWATGTLDGQYTLGLTGLDAAALRESATGSASFKWNAGTLRHVSLEGKGAPLTFATLSGRFTIRNGSVTCEDCKMQSAGQLYTVTGSATFARDLDFRRVASGASAYAISGPLDRPRGEAVPIPASEAKLH